MSGTRRLGVLAIAGVALAAAGCMHGGPGGAGGFDHDHGPVTADGVPITVPPAGAVPREMDKITLPPYVIEAPDQLLIEVVQRSRAPKTDKEGVPLIDPKTKEPIMDTVTDRLPVQPVSGQFAVRLDGTVGLGFWGSVPVSGLTLDQAAESIRAHLLRQATLSQFGTKPESITVIVDVIAYNSKRYYVIFDGGGPGAGEQVVSFP